MNEAAPKRQLFSARELGVLAVIGTSCLCLLILISGIMFGLVSRKLPLEALGTVQGATAGTGLAGFGVLLFMTIRLALSPEKADGNSGK